MVSISKLPKMASGLSGHARVLAACKRSCPLEVDSFTLTLKFRKPRKHFERFFFLALAAFGRDLLVRRALGLDFGSRNAWIFEGFRALRPLAIKSRTQGRDIAKTVVFAAPNACEFAANAFLPRCGDKVVLRMRFGASWERPGPSTWRRPHGQHGAQDGQHGAQDNPTWRPAAVPSASRRVPSGTRSDPRRPGAHPSNI